VAWHAVDTSPIEQGDSVLVLGGGPIGLGVIQCLKARSATTIIVAEVARERQNFAGMFGATQIFDPCSEDVVKKSKEICAGQGPKIAFDSASVPISIKTAVLAVRPRGTVVNVAIWEKEVPFQPNSLVFGEKRYLARKCLLEAEYRLLLTELVLGYQRND
jgi:threonine dehydrogenase-like Zn-dependent dehydrogenase